MGKRELVLIAVFLVIGVGVYQVTAPPPPPGSEVSVGGIFQRMKRGVRGPRDTATAEWRRSFPAAPSIQRLRVNIPRASDLTITGSDRDDVAVELKVTARGYDQGDAKAAAGAAEVKVETAGDALVLTGGWTDRPQRQQAFIAQVALTIALPRRLTVSLQPHIGLLAVANVAAVEAVSSRGETRVSGTAGAVQLTVVGGTLEVSGGTSLKLTARNSRGQISKIAGATTIDATGSRLTLSELAGSLEVESRNTDVSLEPGPRFTGPLRYNATGGELRVDGLRAESRIDGRNTDIGVGVAAPAPVTIYNVGAIVVTAPPGGYTLDAVAADGRISVDEPGITPVEGPDMRAAGKVRGGGPPLTLRATRGRIEIRRPAAGAGK